MNFHFSNRPANPPARPLLIWGASLLLLLGGTLRGYSQVTPQDDLEEEDIVGTLVMVDESTEAVLDLLEKLTGRVILRPQNIQPQKINFDSRGPLTREQAIIALESLLSMNGLAIVEVDETFSRAVQSSVPINSFTPEILSPEDLDAPPTQKVYSRIYNFDFLTVDQVLEILPNFTTPNVPAPIPFRQANSIMVTDALSNLQRLETIFADLDQPRQFDDLVLFIPLEHVGVRELQDQLTRLAENSLAPWFSGNTTFAADERTNQLVVFTHPSNEPIIRDLVSQFDIDVAPFTGSEVFYIKHAEATAVANLIEQVISGQRDANDNTQSAGANLRNNRNPQANAQSPQNPQVQANLESGSPNLQFSEFVGIVADERSNAIVAYGTASDINYIQDLIGKIDILLAQVRIEVIIAEVTLSNEVNRGIEAFEIDYNVDTGSGFPGDNEIGFNLDGRAFDLAGTVKDFSLQSVFDTARTNSNVEVLSAPAIVTTHNQEAIINVSESRPIITSVQSDTTNVSSTRSNVSFRDIGIRLTVKPLIGSNGVIQMEIEQAVESVVGTTLIDGNEQPIIGVREATSFVSVSDQEVVVLGGLQETTLSDTRGRVSLFGDIPLLGELFRNKRKEERVRELLIFIRPVILADTQQASSEATRMIEESNSREPLDSYLREGLEIDQRSRRDPGPTIELWRWISDPLTKEENEESPNP